MLSTCFSEAHLYPDITDLTEDRAQTCHSPQAPLRLGKFGRNRNDKLRALKSFKDVCTFRGLLNTRILVWPWVWFASILLRIFALMFMRETALYCFFCCVFIWLWHQGNPGFIQRVWKFHSFPTLQNNLGGVGLGSSLKVWYNSAVYPSQLGCSVCWFCFVWGDFLLTCVNLTDCCK